MFSVLTMTMAIAAAPQDAPVKLITDHGVELRADEDVFVLFAALNALGYGEETRRKGPPLRAPVFHSIRVEVRDALREVNRKGGTAGIRAMFDKHPAEIETYLEAILAANSEGSPKVSKDAQKLKTAIDALKAFREDAQLTALFDRLAEEQRTLASTLKGKVEADFGAAGRLLGVSTIRAPTTLVVVPNPLDGHAIVRRVDVGKNDFLLVGPGQPTARKTILAASLRPTILAWVKASWSKAGKFQKHWEGIKTSRRITQRYGSGENYLASAITGAVVHRVRSKKTRDADEDFIDELNKNGNRWGRAALKLIDDAGKGPFSEELPKLLARVSP